MYKRKVSFDRRYSIFAKGGSTVSTPGFVPLPARFNSGLEIERQEVFLSTWQLLEQTISTAAAQDFSTTVSESQSIFIQRRASKHTTFSLWTKQFSRIQKGSV